MAMASTVIATQPRMKLSVVRDTGLSFAMTKHKKFVHARRRETFPRAIRPFDLDNLDRAIDAARRAFPAWAATPWQERVGLLRRAVSLLEERVYFIGAALALEAHPPSYAPWSMNPVAPPTPPSVSPCPAAVVAWVEAEVWEVAVAAQSLTRP